MGSPWWRPRELSCWAAERGQAGPRAGPGEAGSNAPASRRPRRTRSQDPGITSLRQRKSGHFWPRGQEALWSPHPSRTSSLPHTRFVQPKGRRLGYLGTRRLSAWRPKAASRPSGRAIPPGGRHQAQRTRPGNTSVLEWGLLLEATIMTRLFFFLNKFIFYWCSICQHTE